MQSVCSSVMLFTWTLTSSADISKSSTKAPMWETLCCGSCGFSFSLSLCSPALCLVPTLSFVLPSAIHSLQLCRVFFFLGLNNTLYFLLHCELLLKWASVSTDQGGWDPAVNSGVVLCSRVHSEETFPQLGCQVAQLSGEQDSCQQLREERYQGKQAQTQTLTHWFMVTACVWSLLLTLEH